MELSKRLGAVAMLVQECDSLADIGTDHGYIPIYLLEHQKIQKAVAMDINKGPLERARDRVNASHLQEKICLRLSNGAEKLEVGEVDAVVIAGMGGPLMVNIMKNRLDVFRALDFFVLQPQSEIEQVRHFLQEQGFVITKENMVYEEGKYYSMMQVESGTMNCKKECEFLYGPWLLREKNVTLLEFLKKEEKKYLELLEKLSGKDTESQRERYAQLQELLMHNREAMAYYKEGEEIGMQSGN